MNDLIKLITENYEITSAIIALVFVIIGFIVKKTKNKVDDSIWAKIKSPLKNYLDNKFNKKEEVEPTETEVK